MASPALKEYFSRLAADHRAEAAAADGALRVKHREKADQYERLAGKRDLFRGAE
jgi:hypothetical protein